MKVRWRCELPGPRAAGVRDVLPAAVRLPGRGPESRRVFSISCVALASAVVAMFVLVVRCICVLGVCAEVRYGGYGAPAPTVRYAQPGLAQPGFVRAGSPYTLGKCLERARVGTVFSEVWLHGSLQSVFFPRIFGSLHRYSQKAYESKHAGDAQLASLKEARRAASLVVAFAARRFSLSACIVALA